MLDVTLPALGVSSLSCVDPAMDTKFDLSVKVIAAALSTSYWPFLDPVAVAGGMLYHNCDVVEVL